MLRIKIKNYKNQIVEALNSTTEVYSTANRTDILSRVFETDIVKKVKKNQVFSFTDEELTQNVGLMEALEDLVASSIIIQRSTENGNNEYEYINNVEDVEETIKFDTFEEWKAFFLATPSLQEEKSGEDEEIEYIREDETAEPQEEVHNNIMM